MNHYEKGIEFGIHPRWDKRVNVWCQMKSTSLGIETERGELNEFPVQTIIGVIDDQWGAMNFCSSLANEFRNKFRKHLFIDTVPK